jgi:hypothetical protein
MGFLGTLQAGEIAYKKQRNVKQLGDQGVYRLTVKDRQMQKFWKMCIPTLEFRRQPVDTGGL